MAHPHETRARLRQLYIEGMALKPAALAVGVNYVTAQAWKKTALSKGDNWDTQRAAYSVSSGNIDDVSKRFAVKVIQQSMRLAEEIDNSKLEIDVKIKMHASMADSMAKTTKGIKRFAPELTEASAAIGTFKIIIDYLTKNDPELLKAFSDHFDGIGNELRRVYGA